MKKSSKQKCSKFHLLHARIHILLLSRILPRKIRSIYEESPNIYSGVHLTIKYWIVVNFAQKVRIFIKLQHIKFSLIGISKLDTRSLAHIVAAIHVERFVVLSSLLAHYRSLWNPCRWHLRALWGIKTSLHLHFLVKLSLSRVYSLSSQTAAYHAKHHFILTQIVETLALICRVRSVCALRCRYVPID